MTTPNEELIERLHEDAEYHLGLAAEFDMPPRDTINWEHAQSCLAAINTIEAQAERIATQDAEIERLNTEIRLQYAHDTIEIDTLRAELADAELHTKQVERGLDKATAQLAAIAATEPSMIYHGRCVIDCGDSGHQDVTMLKMITRETKLFTHPMPAQDVKDAERYRWLREQHWSTDTIAVVLNPKQAVKLGYVCPSDSLLDETIDAAIAKGAK